jgi:hypothetical protein
LFHSRQELGASVPVLEHVAWPGRVEDAVAGIARVPHVCTSNRTPPGRIRAVGRSLRILTILRGDVQVCVLLLGIYLPVRCPSRDPFDPW